mmetsp:Transcript_39717/g.101533  ORF Transcript_39717/g.101533 Transcript_39717/m.101533 type:complete len:204 (-) Transcript_39717:274-885(-)
MNVTLTPAWSTMRPLPWVGVIAGYLHQHVTAIISSSPRASPTARQAHVQCRLCTPILGVLEWSSSTVLAFTYESSDGCPYRRNVQFQVVKQQVPGCAVAQQARRPPLVTSEIRCIIMHHYSRSDFGIQHEWNVYRVWLGVPLALPGVFVTEPGGLAGSVAVVVRAELASNRAKELAAFRHCFSLCIVAPLEAFIKPCAHICVG